MDKDRIVKSLVINAEENIEASRVRYKNPQLTIKHRALKDLPADCIRVEMIYTGVCGTDIHLVQKDPLGFIMTSAPLSIPEEGRVFGHEGVGRIVELGSNVTQFVLGDIVALESIVTCGICEPCRRGHFNQCLNAKLMGMQSDGLFTNIADIPQSLAHNVNAISHNDAGLRASACLEPAGVAWLACENVKLSGGDRVLIFGGGPIGYFCAMLAKLVFGASWIGLVDPVQFRRNFATQWCDEVFDINSPELLKNKYDVVIEASGFLENIQQILSRIKANGRVALLARSGQPLKLDSVDHIITNSISLMGVRGHLCGAFGRLIELYQLGKLPLHNVVTNILGDLEVLKENLSNQDELINKNCKVLVKLNDFHD
jgi:threonine dehydrogenase-like Zn-dependent dehydrogenase